MDHFLALIVTLFIFIFLYQHYKFEDYDSTLGPSRYFTAASFPRKVVLIRGKWNIDNDEKLLNEAINTINKTCNYNFFSPIITAVNEEANALNIHYARRKHLNHKAFDGRGTVLAHAEMPPGNRLCFDIDEDWDEIKFETTFIHEAFHTLGLDHNRNLNSIMYPKYQPLMRPTALDVYNLRLLFPFMHSGGGNPAI